MVETLALAAGLDGALACILGAFFFFSAFTEHDMMRKGERRRLAALIGLMLIALGVSSLLVFWTGGLGPYLKRGGSPIVGQVALGARAVAAVLLLILIVDSLLIWRRARISAEKRQRGRGDD